MTLCAICVNRPADPGRTLDGCLICAQCDEEPAEHVNSERRCETSEGIGSQFALDVAEKYRRTLPKRLLRLDADCDRGVAPPVESKLGRAWWDDNFSENQLKYQAQRGRNRGMRKGGS